MAVGDHRAMSDRSGLAAGGRGRGGVAAQAMGTLGGALPLWRLRSGWPATARTSCPSRAGAGALSLQFAGLSLPFRNDLLKTRPLTGLELLVVFAVSTLGYAAIRLDRVMHKDGRWRPRTSFRRPGAPGGGASNRPRRMRRPVSA